MLHLSASRFVCKKSTVCVRGQTGKPEVVQNRPEKSPGLLFRSQLAVFSRGAPSRVLAPIPYAVRMPLPPKGISPGGEGKKPCILSPLSGGSEKAAYGFSCRQQ